MGNLSVASRIRVRHKHRIGQGFSNFKQQEKYMKEITKYWISSFFLLSLLLIFSISCDKKDDNSDPTPSGTVKDIDGNVYHTVTIGTQVWMVENLKTTKYRNGESITYVGNGPWAYYGLGAYCDYDLDINKSNTYGRLYKWATINDNRKLAPTGWHVPSVSEWRVLTSYLGGESVAGKKLKETGTTHWEAPTSGATNETGFTALPGGYRDESSYFGYIGQGGYWWSSSFSGNGLAYHISMHRTTNAASINDFGRMECGFSVRCVKD
jgi:uncharacterized protein (TIGR02145 family)